MNAFDKFPLLSCLKTIKPKCEIAGICALKGVSQALCGINLTIKMIKILGILFSYYIKLESDENFIKHIKHVGKIKKVLKLWRMKNLTVEGKITIFKTLGISKTKHLSLVTNVLMEIFKEMNLFGAKLN